MNVMNTIKLKTSKLTDRIVNHRKKTELDNRKIHAFIYKMYMFIKIMNSTCFFFKFSYINFKL